MGDVPVPRVGHGSAIIDNLLYVFGGSSDDGYLNDFYSFDLTSK
jgi:hypothetical protein